jgi:hypothetical protein
MPANAQCRSSQPLHEHLSNLKSNLIEGQSSTSKVLVNTMAHIKKTTQCIPFSLVELRQQWRGRKAETETDTAGA